MTSPRSIQRQQLDYLLPMKATLQMAKPVLVTTFFVFLLIIGLRSYADYNVSWDEPTSRTNGGVAIKYIAQELAPFLLSETLNEYPNLKDYGDSDYGVAFEAPAVLFEHLFNLTDDRDVFLFRHFLTFLVSLGGAFAVYRLASRRFEDWRVGLLAAAFLVLTPRMFAESFYNSKDLVFMALFAIATNTMLGFVTKPRVQTALVHALATAVAIDVRIMAIGLVPCTIAIVIIKLVKGDISARQAVSLLSIFFALTCIFVVAMWPWLWSAPLENFVQAFRSMSKFRWDYEVRYMGEFVQATKLPWHYSFVWISITTPILYLGLFAIGFVATARLIISHPLKLWSSDAEMQDIVFLGLFLASIVSVIVLRSVLYDGWRQLYFIYPAMLLIATKGWTILWNARDGTTGSRVALGAVTLISAGHTAFWMWNAHPLQNVYFNLFAGDRVLTRYEMDYWGLGNRKALEYILSHDDNPVINVSAASWTRIEYSFILLSPQDKTRIRNSNDKTGPLYILTNYRGVKVDDTRYSKDYELFYQLTVSDEIILSVYKWIGAQRRVS